MLYSQACPPISWSHELINSVGYGSPWGGALKTRSWLRGQEFSLQRFPRLWNHKGCGLSLHRSCKENRRALWCSGVERYQFGAPLREGRNKNPVSKYRASVSWISSASRGGYAGGLSVLPHRAASLVTHPNDYVRPGGVKEVRDDVLWALPLSAALEEQNPPPSSLWLDSGMLLMHYFKVFVYLT